MYDIPKNVYVGEQSYHIRNDGDFRMVLDCFSALEDKEMDKKERIATALIIFYDGMETPYDLEQFDIQQAYEEMVKFFNCGQLESIGVQTNYKSIDWELDQQIICSAVNKVAGKEIRELPYLHWWTFMGYYLAVGNSTLATVVSIRGKIAKGKKLEKWEKEFKRDNAKYFSFNVKQTALAEAEAEELFRQLWNVKED